MPIGVLSSYEGLAFCEKYEKKLNVFDYLVNDCCM